MKKTIFTTLILTLAFASSFAGISVYFFSGKIEILEKGKQPRQIIAINEAIAETASLRLAEHAEIILKDKSGQFAIIHKVGDFSPEQIQEQFKLQKGKGLVSSLAGFLGTQFTEKKDDIRKMSESYMKQKGGVTRAGSSYPLMLWPPYGSLYDTTDVRFVWNAAPGVKKYEFVVFGGEDANNPVQLSKTLETDTFMDVNFKDFASDKDYYFSWVAYPEGDPNYTRYTFKLTSNGTLQKLEQEVNEIAAKESTEEARLLVKAIAYEKAGLAGRAEDIYSELLKKYNSNINQQLYSLFKIRNNIVSGKSGR